ncbi:MAG: hypothetical protein DMG13_01770 [Acidobacteria bacterium]|nr:MAG: hypothetical protein DMG13_01770 [Acidobacteriota bacterium]
MRGTPDETKGAAERRQNIASAEGRGFRLRNAKPRQGRKIVQARQSFAPDGAWFSATNAFHGLQPWLRSCAAPRLKTEELRFELVAV